MKRLVVATNCTSKKCYLTGMPVIRPRLDIILAAATTLVHVKPSASISGLRYRKEIMMTGTRRLLRLGAGPRG